MPGPLVAWASSSRWRSVSPLAAQQFIGPSKCTSCHDHARQATKWQKEEPAQFKDKAHFNTRKQLDGPKAAAYAKAVGLADSYDVKGSCVACHSTVFRGDANAGVSCESCHGPGSGYLEPHQAKGAYAKSVSLGLRDLKAKPPAIAKACVTCHLTTDRKLLAAGHPAGANFDVGTGLKNVVALEDGVRFRGRDRRGQGGHGTGRLRAPPPLPLRRRRPPPRKAPLPPPHRRRGQGGRHPRRGRVTAGGAAVAPPAACRGARRPRRRPAAAAPATGAAAAPWDWDQPIRALPQDYVPEAAAPEPARARRRAAAAPSAAPRLLVLRGRPGGWRRHRPWRRIFP